MPPSGASRIARPVGAGGLGSDSFLTTGVLAGEVDLDATGLAVGAGARLPTGLVGLVCADLVLGAVLGLGAGLALGAGFAVERVGLTGLGLTFALTGFLLLGALPLTAARVNGVAPTSKTCHKKFNSFVTA